MSKETTMFICKIAGSDVVCGSDVVKIKEYMNSEVKRLCSDGWKLSGNVVRHQRGYVAMQWLEHTSRKNKAGKGAAKMTVGYTECDVM